MFHTQIENTPIARHGGSVWASVHSPTDYLGECVENIGKHIENSFAEQQTISVSQIEVHLYRSVQCYPLSLWHRLADDGYIAVFHIGLKIRSKWQR